MKDLDVLRKRVVEALSNCGDGLTEVMLHHVEVDGEILYDDDNGISIAIKKVRDE